MRDTYVAKLRGTADVAARKPIDVVDNASGGHCCCAAHAFLGGLKKDFDGAFEPVPVF